MPNYRGYCVLLCANATMLQHLQVEQTFPLMRASRPLSNGPFELLTNGLIQDGDAYAEPPRPFAVALSNIFQVFGTSLFASFISALLACAASGNRGF